MARPLRTAIIVILVLVALAALLYRMRGAIGLEGFDWGLLAGSLRDARLGLLLLSLAAIFVAYAVRARRWMRFCRHLGPSTFSSVYADTLIGFTALFLLGRAGEPVRPILIARSEKLPTSSMFGIYVLERLFDVASAAALVGLALLWFPRTSLPGEGGALLAALRTSGGMLTLGVAAAVVFLVYLRLHGGGWLERRLETWRHSGGWRARVAGLSLGFGEGLQAIRTPRDLAAGVFYSALHWSVVFLIYYWVSIAFGGRMAEFGPAAYALVLAFTMIGSMLQLPGVGGGAQVGSFLAYTVVLGVGKEPAAAASIVLWMITFAGVSLAGLPLLVNKGLSMAELRRMARATGAQGESESTAATEAAPEHGDQRP
jgi:glycosyltransferase 2 family protein